MEFGYVFDDIGNRTQTTVNGRTAHYTPDALNQYDQRQVPRAIDVRGDAVSAATITVNGNSSAQLGDYFHHALDLSASGNAATVESILVTASLPDGSDGNAPRIADAETSEFLPANPEIFTHDADGNLTDDDQWQYTWDAENRLIEMETVAAAYNAGVDRLKVEFAYDSLSRRFSKKTYQWSSVSSEFVLSSDTVFIYDGWNLLYELNSLSSGLQAAKSYTWGIDLSGTLQGAGGVGGLLMVTFAGDANYYPIFDGNGNVMQYIEADSGASVAEFEYGPFGELIKETGSQKDAFNFRFSTKYQDTETGLLYYGYRYYDAATGRWLNRDPIGEVDSINLYGFIGNDGVNEADLLGLRRVSRANRLARRNISPNTINLQSSYQSAVRNYNRNPNRANRDRLQRLMRRANNESVRLGAQQRPGSAIRNNPFLTAAEREAAIREGIRQPTLMSSPSGNSRRDRLEQQLREAEIIRRELQARCIDGLGRVTGNYDAQNPGPLSRDLAGTFSGGRYRETILQQDTVFYRAGQSGQPLGQFFDTSPSGGILQARIDKAILPRWPGGGTSPIDTTFGVRVPAGTRVYTGTVSSQGGVYIGGTQQVVIPRPWTINGVEVISSSPLQ